MRPLPKVWLFFLVLLVAGLCSCAVSPLEDQDASSSSSSSAENPELIKAWVWAVDTIEDSLWAIHTVDKEIWERFSFDFRLENGWTEGGLVGGGIYPTWWTFNPQSIVAYTSGILDHGDHGHIVHPELHVSLEVTVDDSVVDLMAAPKKKTLAAALVHADGASGQIIFVGYNDGDTTEAEIPFAPQNLALSDSTLLIRSGDSLYAYAYPAMDLRTTLALDSCLDLHYDSAGHGFYAACMDGVYRMDADSLNLTLLADSKPEGGAIQRLLGAPGSGLALGIAGCGSSGLVVLNTRTASAQVLESEGAFFPGAGQMGLVDISDDGSIALLADTAKPVLYKLNLATQEIQSLEITAVPLGVALNYDGSRAWMLQPGMVYQVSFDSSRVVDSLEVSTGVTGIYISSYSDNSALYDSDDHTF
ncbi:MAG TPA: hypothetical protein VLM37_04540 [Fibrobacteraceae bacterium]|nr:hypothetical protein [Fibrobacteraceae bacterium]